MGVWVNRRQVTASLGAFLVTVGFPGQRLAATEAPIQLEWQDLLPETSNRDQSSGFSLGVIEHGQLSTPENQSAMADVTTRFDGKMVRLPGYVVPLDYAGVGVTSLLLVPYVGACIHVPPPPPNQLVFVTTDRPYEFEGLFDAVWVTGVMNSGVEDTELAEVGYSIRNGALEPYRWE